MNIQLIASAEWFAELSILQSNHSMFTAELRCSTLSILKASAELSLNILFGLCFDQPLKKSISKLLW